MGLHVLVENKFFGAQQEKYPKPALPVVVLPFFKAASKSQKKNGSESSLHRSSASSERRMIGGCVHLDVFFDSVSYI